MTTKKMVIIKGKGTSKETRIETSMTLYRTVVNGRFVWVTIPTDD